MPKPLEGRHEERFLAAIRAEGIDAMHAGYSLPVYRQPVLLAKNFGLATPPLFSGVYPQIPDYSQVACPATDRACDAEAVWVRQNVLLGERQDMDDIVAAIDKIQRHSHELQE